MLRWKMIMSKPLEGRLARLEARAIEDKALNFDSVPTITAEMTPVEAVATYLQTIEATGHVRARQKRSRRASNY